MAIFAIIMTLEQIIALFNLLPEPCMHVASARAEISRDQPCLVEFICVAMIGHCRWRKGLGRILVRSSVHTTFLISTHHKKVECAGTYSSRCITGGPILCGVPLNNT